MTWIIGAASIAVIAVIWNLQDSGRANVQIRLAAREIGLEYAEHDGTAMASGAVGSLHVQITIDRPTLSVTVTARDLPGLRLDHEQFGDALRPEALTPAALACLPSELRTRLLDAPASTTVSLIGRRLTITGSTFSDPLVFHELPRLAVAIGTFLRQCTAGLSQRLAHSASYDPDPAFRRRAARALFRRANTGDERDEVIARGVNAPDPAMRLLCAQQMGPAGDEVLLHLAQSGAVSTAIRREAIRALEPRGETQRQAQYDILDALFGRAPSGLVPDIVRAVAKMDRTLSLRKLFRKLHAVGPVDAAVAILGHAGHHGAAACSLLLHALNHERREVQAEAAKLLGEHGDHACIPALATLAAGRAAPEVKTAARAAAGSIQERLGLVSGGLAIMDDTTHGAVSVAAATAGALSGS